MSDELKIAPWEIVPDIIKILEPNFPEFLAMSHTLRSYWLWKTQSQPDLEVYLLTPDGKVDDYGTFVLYIPAHQNNVVFDSLHPDHDRLKRLLINCDVIDWSRELLYFPIRAEFKETLDEIFEIKKLKRKYPDILEHAFYMEKELALKLTFECPPEVYIASPKEDDAQLIDSVWPHREDDTIEVISFLIRNHGGVGIYLKETNELVAWALVNFYFGPGPLQTVETQKRKGYGILAAKAVTKLIAEKGSHSICFILDNNTASQNLFLKLGYKRGYPTLSLATVPDNWK